MRIRKHHATALLLLGIAVCAGFFLSIPATAGPGKGFEALESGDLFRSPFGTTPPEPSVSPALPEDTPDLLPAPDDAEPAMPVGPDNTSEPAGTDNTSEPAGPDHNTEPAGPDNTSTRRTDNASEPRDWTTPANRGTGQRQRTRGTNSSDRRNGMHTTTNGWQDDQHRRRQPDAALDGCPCLLPAGCGCRRHGRRRPACLLRQAAQRGGGAPGLARRGAREGGVRQGAQGVLRGEQGAS